MPNRAVLTALRAAAIVIIATGLNEVIAGAVPRYEPLYIYLAAIALVVYLDGIVMGLVTAAVAVGFYGLLYMPRPAALSAAMLVPAGAALGTVALAAIVRGVVRARARRREAIPEIFPRMPAALDVPSPARDQNLLAAIEDLRIELRERESALERSFGKRLQAADEDRSRLSQLLQAERSERDRLEAAARLAEAEARQGVAELRRSVEELRGENETLRASVEAARAEAQQFRGDAEDGRSALEAVRAEAAARGGEAAALRAQLETVRADAETTRAETERLRAENETLRTALETSRAELSERTGDVTVLRAGADELRKSLDIERARNEGERTLRTIATERVTELERALHAERSARATDAARAAETTAALEQTAADERTLRERLELDAQARDAAAATLRTRIRELEQSLESARLRAAEQERLLRERIAELEHAVAAEHARTTTLRQGIAELERGVADAGALRTEAATLRERIGELERGVADGAMLRAEAATLRDRIAELERSLDSTRIGAEEERALRERVEREAQAQVDEASLLRIRIGELEQALADVAAAEGAQAETLRGRIAEAEDAAARAEAEATRLHAQVAELERAGEQAAEEFNQRLNTIVAHLATDHEADLGKAMEEKTEARAEVRSLTLRLKKADDERQALIAKVREIEERYRNSIEDSTLLLEQTRTAAQGEIDRLHGRVVELEHGIAHGIAQGLVAPPAAKPVARPRILVAHPDADLRMNARASLERAGYEIITAADGLEALRLAIAQRPDVVLADAVMPKMDGRELCQLLKSQEKTAHICVVLLLRATDEPPKGELVPDEVLRKPVPLEVLKSTLAGLLASRK